MEPEENLSLYPSKFNKLQMDRNWNWMDSKLNLAPTRVLSRIILYIRVNPLAIMDLIVWIVCIWHSILFGIQIPFKKHFLKQLTWEEIAIHTEQLLAKLLELSMD